MIPKPVLVSALCLGLLSASFAQTAATSESLLAEARKTAKAENKNVLVIFHASWCSWCKKLDQFLASEQFKPIFEQNFVTVHLTVLERREKAKNENPGAMDVLTWLGGKDAGLPFFGILDSEGKQVATSLRFVEGIEKGMNTGFPATKEEIAHFIQMLRKGAPKITPEQLDAVRKELSKKPTP